MSDFYKEVDGGASVVACTMTEAFADQWHVRVTAAPGVDVSTKFLGTDHGGGMAYGFDPVLYETMIFGGSLDGSQWRYTDRCAAEAGHKQAIASVKAVSA